MTDRAAIMGSLVDVRNIGVHKSVKLTIHVPEEQAVMVINAFGWPTGVDPVPVAIARLSPEAKEREPVQESNPPVRARKSWDELPPPQQAAIRCNEPAFQKFLQEKFRARWKILSGTDAENAAELVRVLCKVESRSQLTIGSRAATQWHVLDSEYKLWMQAVA